GGTINSSSEYWVGVDSITTNAINNISGTSSLNISNWVSLGRGGTANVNFSGGTFYKTGNGQFIVGDGGTCVFNQSGGATLIDDNELWIGQAGSGSGTFNLTNGTASIGSWLAVGRESGQGVLNIYSGSMTKSGGGNISIAHNDNAHGTVNIYGGAFTNTTSETWVGENGGNTAKGTWNMYGGVAVLGVVHLANASDVQGQMNLNGGSLTATEISTGNNTAPQRELNLNGGTLVAGTNNASFIHDLSAANVLTNGAIIDTASYTAGVNQALLGGVNGDGGLVKNGSGTLYLNGANTYTNLTQVNAGALGGTGTIMGPVTVASGARLSPGTTAIGTLTINNSLSLSSGSSTMVKISMDGGATNDMVGGLSSVSYNGTLVVTNAGSSPLVNGAQFQLFNAAGHGGNFANAASVTILPAGKGSFDPATGKLTITSSGTVVFNPVRVSGNNLILTGNGGAAPGSAYTLLMSTNVATSLSMWETNTTGVLDGSGMFSNSIPINALDQARFFDVRVP
ncbi:MAG TPA: autotransporter-associated beta strand repeat-containing protein, partial [Candidatus Binatia bacterium]|nr:autotransporter-associated beta strand repeat-containing protein [Candidatus Binatia bacterium]